jgi:hypothetical protein
MDWNPAHDIQGSIILKSFLQLLSRPIKKSLEGFLQGNVSNLVHLKFFKSFIHEA